MAISTRSRTICSTSRPTYPTSVNLVASTLRNGAPASLARRREISVLPTPVGPIIKMFFGNTSSRNRSSSCRRRQRLRSAIETARLASACPTMKRSSSETISRGEKSVMAQLRMAGRWFPQAAKLALDDRWARLPVADRLIRIEQHDDVQGQVVANVKTHGDLEDDRQRDSRSYRKLQRQQEAHGHEAHVRDRVDDAVAVV